MRVNQCYKGNDFTWKIVKVDGDNIFLNEQPDYGQPNDPWETFCYTKREVEQKISEGYIRPIYQGCSSIRLIEAERQRQIEQEGYTEEHDDNEINEELSLAASIYASPHGLQNDLSHLFPWEMTFYKPDKTNTIEGRIKELVKAGALIAAEIDRLERLQTKNQNP